MPFTEKKSTNRKTQMPQTPPTDLRAIGSHRFRVAPDFEPPAVIEDSREQNHLPFSALEERTRLLVVRTKLEVGDYTADGLETDLFIERKDISDLVGSVTHDRERFVRELDFAAALPFRWRYLLVVGSNPSVSCEKQMQLGTWRSLATARSVRASVNAFAAKYGLLVRYCDSPLDAAAVVCETIRYCARHLANVRWTQRGYHEHRTARATAPSK